MDRKEIEAKFGKYNDFPPNWQPCDPAYFWGKFMSYSQSGEEYRQMMRPEKHIQEFPPNAYGQKTIRNARLYFYNDDTGLAMVQDYDYKKMEDRQPLLYKFAVCDHDAHGWESVPSKSYMCYHVSKCKNCGMERAVDSSD